MIPVDQTGTGVSQGKTSAHIVTLLFVKRVFYTVRSSCPKAYTMTTIVSFDPSSSSTLPYLQPAAIDPAVCILPLLLHRVPAGFPSPADEYVEKGLDLNTYLVRNKVATYFFRVVGDSMTGAHIHDGDMLVVDRSIEPKHGHIVLAVINNEYTVKRLYACDGVVELHAENPAYPPIRCKEHEELQVWGVVVGTIARFAV
ncbi:DNA polymerase V [Nitrosomonas nitrosa]|uniref:LexA family protein n=1 Tax=Nitrosomonas nitrosa TaxID=52442 RepID=UPI000D4E33D6|nr:translesion error-prone DNA polymerase V autoproteolytic subunit [Nitrosomonas nitrosa]PTR04672.1 DNA polymerase V [Nitrosomonas nitrosa]